MKLKPRAVTDILAENQKPEIDGIIVIDYDGTVLAFDSTAQTLFGYAYEEVVAHPIEMLMPDVYARMHPEYLKRATKKSGNKARQLHIERAIIGKHKQGHSIPLAITVSADNSTNNIRFTGVIQDLRKHETQLNKLFQDFQATTDALNQRIDFEKLLNVHGNNLLSCSADKFYTIMEEALQAIAQFLSLDHCYILKVSDDLCQASLWTEWRRSVSLMKPFADHFDIPNGQAFFQALSSTFSSNNMIVLERGQNEENETVFELAQQLSPNGFHSTRITPILNDKGSIAGIIGFSVLDPTHQPTEAQLSLLSLAIQLIINAWGRHQLILQAHQTEENIRAKNKLLANRAAFSQTLLHASNSLFLSSRNNIKIHMQEVLSQAALISGYQQALVYFEQDSSHNLERFIKQQLNTDPPTQLLYPKLVQWVSKELDQQSILHINDMSKLELSSALASELQHYKIQGFTAVKLNRADLLIGFIIFYNSSPVLSSNDDNLRFLQLTGQNLAAAIQHHSTLFDLEISEQNLLSANQLLAQQALNDALTGLANRRAFDHAIGQEFDRAQRHNGTLTLLMCDIDYFKYYNDHYGHPQGDICLQQVAQMLQRTFNRAGELCTRYGGEEFAIILPSISHQEAELQAQRLINKLMESKIEQSPTAPFDYISLSIGIAQLSPNNPYSDYSVLINEADKALYQAKNNGRNQLAWATKAE
jgi:diguanylate cyclase (GGDEF)-like protein/PAS domain S-box-containing protein